MVSMATLGLIRAPAAGLAVVGIFWGGFAGLMPDIKARAGASDADFGLMLMLSALGAISAMALAPRIFHAAGRATLPLAGVAVCLAFYLPWQATDLWRLGFGLLAIGAAVGLLDITSNMRCAAIEAGEEASLMNAAHAMFSFAFGLTALGTGLARSAGLGLAEILPVLAGCALLTGLLLFEKTARWHPPEAHEDGTRGPRDSAYWLVVILSAVVLFSAFVGENSTEAWSALHIERTLGGQVGHGSFGPAVLGLVMGVARLGGQTVAARIGERALIAWSAGLGASGALIVAAAPSPFVVYLGVGVVAVGMAVIVPSANTVLGRRISGPWRSHAISRAWMGGMSGFFIGPSTMGLVAEATSLRVSYVVVAGVMAIAIPAIFALGRIPALQRGPMAAAGVRR